jgi:signal transduction histidine kinase
MGYPRLQNLQSPPMKEEQHDVEGPGRAVILVIVVLGAALSLLLWTVLNRNRELELERQTQSYATSLGDVLEGEIGRLMTALRRRAQLWTTDAFTNEMATWHQDVGIFLAENPSLLAVLRADPSWESAGTPEGKQILREVLPEGRRQKDDADREFVVGPLVTSDGRDVFGIQVRASNDASDTRTVFAVFDAHEAIRSLLENRALGFGIAVKADGRELYRRALSPGGRKASSVKVEPLVLPSGETWELEIWPEPSSLILSAERGPAIALASGLLASALLAAMVHFRTLSFRRERMLRRLNAALEEQIRDTLRGESELRALSAGLEARVEERTAELNETIVELETFNYSVSHDLRSPLGAVINFAAILQEDCGDRLDATGREHLQRIVGSASNAVSMMDALLAYSRSGRTELRKTQVGMRRVVEEVCTELSARAPQLIDAVKIGDVPDAWADENMMRFIFTNLIGNACKFARPDETPQVEVSGSFASNEIVYAVRDQGIGFDMRFAEKLFKVFERLHAADGYEGHGVGLAIVARMVRRHGGRVWAQGAVGRGATFYFTVATTGAAGDGRNTA